MYVSQREQQSQWRISLSFNYMYVQHRRWCCENKNKFNFIIIITLPQNGHYAAQMEEQLPSCTSIVIKIHRYSPYMYMNSNHTCICKLIFIIHDMIIHYICIVINIYYVKYFIISCMNIHQICIWIFIHVHDYSSHIYMNNQMLFNIYYITIHAIYWMIICIYDANSSYIHVHVLIVIIFVWIFIISVNKYSSYIHKNS